MMKEFKQEWKNFESEVLPVYYIYLSVIYFIYLSHIKYSETVILIGNTSNIKGHLGLLASLGKLNKIICVVSVSTHTLL